MEHRAALAQAATSTFEALTFLLPSPVLDEVQAAAEPAATVVVAFQGASPGELRLQLFGRLLPQLAANMLGSGEPPSLQLQRDAAGEIANVICGNVLPAVAGAGSVFRLAAPVVELGAPTAPLDADVVLGLEEGRVALSLCFETS